MSRADPSLTIRSLFPAEVMTQEMSVPALVENLHPTKRACLDRSGLRRRFDFGRGGELEPTAPLCPPPARVAFAQGRYLLHDAYIITGLVAHIVGGPRGL